MRRVPALVAATAAFLLTAGLSAQEPAAPEPVVPPTETAPAAEAPRAAPTGEQPPGTPAAEAPPAAPPPSPPAGETPATAAEDVAATEPPADRITFELPVPAEKGGGRVSGSAARIETVGEDEAVLEGAVEIRWKDVEFHADRVVLHRSTSTLEAEGEVVFDQGPRRIAAARVDFDLATSTGTFWNASAYIEPDYYFSGAVVAKTGEMSYEISDGLFTSCVGDETPDWSLRTSRADVEIGGYAHVKNARVRAKKMPFFYWPYLIWPAKTDRTSGMLIPNIGYSERRGAYLGLAYYQVFGPAADATLYLDGYSEEFAGAGAEVRWRPTEGSQGEASLYFLKDPDRDSAEWRGRFAHTSDDLPWGLRGVIAYEDYSDYDFFREFERAEVQNTKRFLYSHGFVSGTWGAQSLNILADQRETFVDSGNVVTQRQLPEIAYRVTKQKLGESRLYLSIDSTASYLESSSSDAYDVGYGRVDLAPELTLPLKVAPWLSVALSAGGRGTWWGESRPETRVIPGTDTTGRFCGDLQVPPEQAYCGDSIDRVYPKAALDLIGPSLSRIFDGGGGKFSKYKHLIEPRWSYVYRGDVEDQTLVPRFDEIDSFEATNTGQLTLVNRLLAKPTDETEGGAFEILSFEVGQAYSFDHDQPLQRSRDGSITSQESGLLSRLRYNPSRDLSIQARVVWSTLFDGLDSTSLSARGRVGRVGTDLTWVSDYDPELSEKRSDQARLGLSVDALPQRLRLAGQVSYDLEQSQIQQQRYFLTWTSQCWSATIEAREQITRSFRSRDYRFLLSLKNVGTFLDLNSGGSTALD